MPTMELVQEKTIDEAIRVFNTHDKEAKGWITTAQSVRVFQEISAKLPFQAEPRDLVADVDPQATGKVQFPDFVLLISRRALERADTELHDAFRTFHSDHGEHKRGLLSLTASSRGRP
ncbi:Calmodulin [Diplonema papillatum]|nr:Calmodulin [Diplonema papillatum]KAJ9449406.1 Calmodulin [Diplonema papillatum]